MLDIRLIRNDLDAVKTALARRGGGTEALDELAALDRRQRELATRRDELRAEVKELSRTVGALHRDGRADDAAALQEQSRAVGA